ncbi:hypothetical protein D9758_018275 [Tetrapyrgos nigripes]|uniref:Glucose-methanol-choline oxidoreductase N-terminal domain-containing protein n=1 Tax=Tetrapyrgos nigripes TaxID=182062 RepID=A0A8H5C2J3_9AGAR|nr:hypothetical protein D9758_018275 [Tetrapyrgos nigripes]
MWRETAINVGFPQSPDLSNGFPHAVGISPSSIDPANNTRCSAVCAYYNPIADQPNFNVITNATVARIIWRKSKANSDLVASSVEYFDSSNQTRVASLNQNGEVIVSAGTIGSPKILELSGVGNSTILREAGIELVLDLPTVGENLADHVHGFANAFTNASLTADVLARNPVFAQQQLAQWFENRTGLFSAYAWSLGLAAPSNIFQESELNDLLANAEKNIDFFASQFSNGNTGLAKGIKAQHEIALDLYRRNENLPLELNLLAGYSGPTPFGDLPDQNYTSISNALYHPLSRGRTHITFADPFAPPLVDQITGLIL